MLKLKNLALASAIIFVAMFTFSLVPAQAKDVPVYKVGIDAAFPPWTWAEKGKIKGFDWELLQYIGKVEGFKIEPADIPWSAIISALSRGKIDILAGGLSFTCKRAKVIDYSEPYWRIGYWTLVRKDSDLNCVTAMSHGAKVGAQAGTTGYRWVKEQLIDKGIKIKLVPYESVDMGIKDVESGRIQSFHVDSPTAREFVKAGRDVKAVCKGLHYDLNAFAVTPGDPHKLLAKINDGLAKAYKSGKFAELVHKFLPWGTVEKTPLDVDYNKLCQDQSKK